MIRWITACLGILSFCIISCSDGADYSASHRIVETGWMYEDPISFNFDISDTSSRYSIILDVEHSSDYLYQNVYLQTVTTFPNGKTTEQELPIDFALKNGTWHGNCRGSSCDLRVVLQEHAFFNQIGNHELTLEQFTRASPLEGIKGLTLKLFKES